MVESGTGGVSAVVGEGKQDEVVFPLETGVDIMTNKLLKKMASVVSKEASQKERSSSLRPLNVHIGTWLGDESGIKRLAREITAVQIFEG